MSVSVKSAEPGTDLASCGLTGSSDVAVELSEPAAGRPITFNVTGTPQQFVSDPSGGYTECVAPSCDPMPALRRTTLTCAGKIVHRFYWRATDTGWTTIAGDDTAGCGQVPTKAPDFPVALCAVLPALTRG